MKINYNLDVVKQRVVSLIKQNAYDFCTDMFKEIKRAADFDDLDAVEGFVRSIRQVEKVSENQVKSVEEANTITDILICTIDNNTVGNVLYECHDLVLEAMFGIKFEEEFDTKY